MNYSELEAELSKIEASHHILDLVNIDDHLIGILAKFIKFGDYPNQLYISEPNFTKLSESSMVLEGTIPIKMSWLSKTTFKVQIIFIKSSKIEYIVGIQPRNSDRWINEVGSEIRRVYEIVDDIVNIVPDELVYIYSSISRNDIPVNVQGKVDINKHQLDIIKGISILLQVDVKLLSIIELNDNWFHISNIDLQNISITKKVDYTIKLIENLEVSIYKVEIISSTILQIETKLTLSFLVGKLHLEPSFTITKNTYKALVKVNGNKLPIEKIVPNLQIGNIATSIEGEFNETAAPVYGFFGDFSIDDKIIEEKEELDYDYTFSTLNDYVFHVKFRPDTNGYYPVFLQAFLKEISLSKIINVVSDIHLDIPSFLDPITFFNTYIYYCDPSFDTTLIDGTKAKKGSAVSSGISFLGIKGYASYYALENGLKGEFQLQPIKNDIIEIGGKGTGSPESWSGSSIKPGGALFNFEYIDAFSLSASVYIKFLNIIEADALARFHSKEGLHIEFHWEILDLKFDLEAYLQSIDNFSVGGKVKIPLLKIDINLDPVGRIKVDLDVSTLFSLKVKGQNISTVFDCSFNLAGKTYSIAKFSFDLEKLEELENAIEEKIKDLLENAFSTALEWLLGIAEGIIEIAEDIAERLKIIGETLKEHFEAGFEEAAKLLSQAEYLLSETVNILSQGFHQNVENLIGELNKLGHELSEIGKAVFTELNVQVEQFASAIKNLGIDPDEVMQALHNGYGLLKDKASQLMKELHYGIKDISKSLASVFNLSPDQVAGVLDKIGYGASDIASALNEVWNIGEQGLRDILRSIGHAGSVINDVLGDIFGGGGSCLLDSFDLVHRSITKFEKDRTYKLLLLRKYRDEYLNNSTEGKDLLEQYNKISENVSSLKKESLRNLLIEASYFDLVINLVAKLEKSGFENAFTSISFAKRELDKLNRILVENQ